MTIPDPYFNETAASTTPRPAPLSRLLLSSLLAAVLFTLICGLAYPLLTTGVAGVLFPNQAQGSLITRDGKVIGSAVLGQNFTAPQYLHGRPSICLLYTSPSPRD